MVPFIFQHGRVLLCDGCPRMYHPACVGLSSIPKGKWYCPVCQKKKSNERNDSEEEEEEDEYDEEVCGFEQ